jgi:hypothetical protein
VNDGRRQNKAGRAIGHTLALAQGVQEILDGVAGLAGGSGEAVVTSPACASGAGCAVPAAGVGTAVVSGALAGHGTAVVLNTARNIFRKGKGGHPAKDTTSVQGTQDQLDDITANQAKQRQAGKPDAIQSTEGSKQKADTALKKIKTSKDVEDPQ